MMESRLPGFFSGLSGLQLNIPKYKFPPPFENASRLEYYSSLFNSIEINSSFYKMPRKAILLKWSSSVPDHFKFTIKLWKEITHHKNLEFDRNDVLTFMDGINVIQQKGCLLIQLPPGCGSQNILQLHELLGCIMENNSSWKLAVEFRNKTWYNQSTYELLQSFQTCMVVHDMPRAATPLFEDKLQFKYLRFHGPTGNYGGSYPISFLGEYAVYIRQWITDGREVYVYFNNTRGDAFNNLIILNREVINDEGTG
jgi:uncharacterized protein YecE (DUF72 family)